MLCWDEAILWITEPNILKLFKEPTEYVYELKKNIYRNLSAIDQLQKSDVQLSFMHNSELMAWDHSYSTPNWK